MLQVAPYLLSAHWGQISGSDRVACLLRGRLGHHAIPVAPCSVSYSVGALLATRHWQQITAPVGTIDNIHCIVHAAAEEAYMGVH